MTTELTAGKKFSALVDIPRCIGCESCSVACKLYNGLDWDEERKQLTALDRAAEPNKGLWPEDWTSIAQYNPEKDGTQTIRFVKSQCFHCDEPACASACFSKAFQKLPEGPVIYDQSLCVGCRYCMLACPFDIIKFEWGKAIPGCRKCQMCAPRVVSGESPACVTACPTGALFYGEEKEVLAEAKRRIIAGGYIDHIFGESEAGGTGWLYISDIPFEEMRFRTDVTTKPLPSYTESYMAATPFIGVGWAAVLAGLYVYNNKGKDHLD
ncbi:MAG: 4Fe-4S dicluster domain-containing protein [Gracilibacteraceae bacterium]|jgi:Fe-S-cluster-containing dehydrogenase component|nr:4Fe-4S dicluster domain-containing protein [Gracilibacteraceae bacterium]